MLKLKWFKRGFPGSIILMYTLYIIHWDVPRWRQTKEKILEQTPNSGTPMRKAQCSGVHSLCFRLKPFNNSLAVYAMVWNEFIHSAIFFHFSSTIPLK